MALSYVTGEMRRLGTTTRLDAISNMNARVGLTYGWGDKLSLSPRFSWQSDPLVASKTVSGSADKTSMIHGQWNDIYQLDLYASYAAGKSLSVFTQLNNITNNHYLVKSLPGNVAAPQDTFNGHLGVTYAY